VSWPLDPIAIAGVLAAGTAYVWADARGRPPRRGADRRRASFLAGLATIVVALDGPIDGAVTTSFSLHMTQHLLLTMVAAPLLLLGAPITVALRASGPAGRRRIAAVVGSRAARVLTNPLVTWPIFFAVVWGAHLTGVYEAALRSDPIHALEHAAFLAAALLFWLPVVSADPLPGRPSHPVRIFYLFVAMPAMALLGLALSTAGHVLYPTYARLEGTARALGDQQTAGALMWGGAMILIVPALGAVLLGWMRAEEREGRRIDERLGRRPADRPAGRAAAPRAGAEEVT
jgi:cytochrome c oxidase assembly factor CtaG